jgi:hypothetical protein
MLSDVLTADGPAPGHEDELALFAPFVGTWDLAVEETAEDGGVSRYAAEWHWGWALGGRAVADVWIAPGHEHGLSLRFPDPAAPGRWRSTWLGPQRGWVIPFTAFRDGAGIVLEGRRDDVALRWIFSDLTPDAFRWRAEETAPGAAPRVRQRFTCTRRQARR